MTRLKRLPGYFQDIVLCFKNIPIRYCACVVHSVFICEGHIPECKDDLYKFKHVYLRIYDFITQMNSIITEHAKYKDPRIKFLR